MIRVPILSAVVLATIAACTAAPPQPEPAAATVITAERPLQTLPAKVDLSVVRSDLVATAGERFGTGALNEALAAPSYLIAKRFAGMLPPPPPGETTREYVPPAALMMKRGRTWMIATEAGWRPATADAVTEIDRVIADGSFWREPATNLPCPDYGASLLVLRVPGHRETVRKSSCTSIADRAVLAALRA